ncbi:hypothetical protein EDB80DRAFT_386907 [Ilyonectria destructans]|nr:hypothetical protein EDB80DRAFT_386907 [Ilyonectria destructans]
MALRRSRVSQVVGGPGQRQRSRRASRHSEVCNPTGGHDCVQYGGQPSGSGCRARTYAGRLAFWWRPGQQSNILLMRCPHRMNRPEAQQTQQAQSKPSQSPVKAQRNSSPLADCSSFAAKYEVQDIFSFRLAGREHEHAVGLRRDRRDARSPAEYCVQSGPAQPVQPAQSPAGGAKEDTARPSIWRSVALDGPSIHRQGGVRV